MTCKNAKRTDQGWECTVAKKPCRYPIPDQSLCTEEYKWIKDIGRRIEEHEIDAESSLQQIRDRYYGRRKSRWDILEKAR